MSAPSVQSAAALAGEMVGRWLDAGGPPSIPADRRADVVAALTRSVVSRAVLNAYVGSLEAAWFANRDHPAIAKYPAKDIPEQQICRSGFGSLADEDLADLALDPCAVRAVADLLTRVPDAEDQFVEAGGWFFEAQSREVDRASGATGPPTASTPARKAGHDPLAEPSRRKPHARPVLLAAAASLAIGLGLGAFLLGGGGGDRERQVVLEGSAVSARVVPRGGEVEFELTLSSPRPGFAAVVVFRPGENPQVYPEEWDAPLPVGPQSPKTCGPFTSTPESNLLVVVTETPAASTLRYALEKRKLRPATMAQLREAVEAELWQHGYRWAAVSTLPIR